MSAHANSSIYFSQCSEDHTPFETVLSCSSEGHTHSRARWCNYLYTPRCPYGAHAGRSEVCKFMHIDAYAAMSPAERAATPMPNLMLKHQRALVKEMKRIVDAKARRTTKGMHWQGGRKAVAAVGPYGEFVDALRSMGWSIPCVAAEMSGAQAPFQGMLRDAPYAGDVQAILTLVASQVHYSIRGTPQIMYSTMRYVFAQDAQFGAKPIPAVEPVALSDPTPLAHKLAVMQQTQAPSHVVHAGAMYGTRMPFRAHLSPLSMISPQSTQSLSDVQSSLQLPSPTNDTEDDAASDLSDVPTLLDSDEGDLQTERLEFQPMLPMAQQVLSPTMPLFLTPHDTNHVLQWQLAQMRMLDTPLVAPLGL